MPMDISMAVMKMIAAVIVTKSMPTANFWLSFATSSENSPMDIIAMLEKNGCSFLKFASRNVRKPIAMSLEISIVTINAEIRAMFDSTALKSTRVPIEMKNIDVKIIAYG